jgi:tetratricopeptide (TPR) repeat protein
MTTRAKHILFSLIPVVLLLLLIVAAEFTLRAFDVAPPPQLVTEVRYDGSEWYQTNRAYLAKYFPAGTPLIPEFKTTLFRKEKGPGTFRIMCLGSSSMFGTPYDMNANIPGIVRKQLRHLSPDIEFEVINWGASAINSNVVRDFAPLLLPFHPDLVLVYMGHNEYYGPDGVGASFLEKHLPFLTRWKYVLREFRLMRLITPLLVGGTRQPPTNLMREVSEGQLVRSGSDDEQRVFGIFDSNLRFILHTFRNAHVPVVVGEPSSNLMFPPFVVDSLSAAAEHYAKGVALRAQGRPEEAKTHLAAARDADLLKFRAPGAISAITRRVCTEEGVPVFNGDSALSARSVDGIAGDSLFWEHLHPTAMGYYVLANAFVNEVIGGGYIPGTPRKTGLLPFDCDSLSICWLDLAYGEYSIRHLTGHWPFENYRRATPILDQADNILGTMVAEVHGRKRTWNEACYAMATYFWRTGRTRDALTTYEAMLEEYPYGFYTNYLEGSLLNSLGRTDEAVRYYRRSLASNPDYTRARLDLGLILVNRGEYDSAQGELAVVLQKSGDDQSERQVKATAHYGLAAVRVNRGDIPGALAELGKALELAPGYPDALRMRQAITGQGR